VLKTGAGNKNPTISNRCAEEWNLKGLFPLFFSVIGTICSILRVANKVMRLNKQPPLFSFIFSFLLFLSFLSSLYLISIDFLISEAPLYSEPTTVILKIFFITMAK